MNITEEKYLEKLDLSNSFTADEITIFKEALELGFTTQQVELFAKKEYSLDKKKLIYNAIKNGVSPEGLILLADEKLDKYQGQELLTALLADIDEEVIEHLAAGEFNASTMNKVIRESIDMEIEEPPTDHKKKYESKEDDEKQNKAVVETLLLQQIKLQEEGNLYLKKLTESITNLVDEQVVLNDFMSKLVLSDKNKPTTDKKEVSKTITSQEELYQLWQEESINQMEGGGVLTETQTVQAEVLESQVKENNNIEITSNYSEKEINVIKELGEENLLKVEKQKNNENKYLYTLFIKLFAKKPFSKKLVELVSEKKLQTEQLEQIAIAIKRGFSEKQLYDLVNSNKSADQMKQIIAIAELRKATFS